MRLRRTPTDEHTVVPGRATPSRTFPRAERWRNPVSPPPCARAAPSPSRGRSDGETRFPHPPARGLRPHLPAGGAMEKPGFPTPLRAGCALTFPRAERWRNPVSPAPARGLRPHLPAGGAMEKPGFPTPLRTGYALPDPPAGGVWGNPVSPSPCARAAPAQTLP